MYIFGIILILILLFKNIGTYSINFTDKLRTLKITTSPLLINIAYNLLYYFSWCQIQLYRLKNNISSKLIDLNLYCNKFLKEKGWVVDIVINQLLVIDNHGNELRNLCIKNKNIVEDEYNNLNYAGLILLDKDINTNLVNHVFYKKIPKSIDYKVSKLKFMSIELTYNNHRYLISLKDDDNNYYIVNNYLDEFFFKYYIKNILKLNVNQNNFDYNVTIIDNDVNIINLLPHQTIKINEDDYEIYPVENKTYNDNTNNDNTNNDNTFYNVQTNNSSEDKLIENEIFIDKLTEHNNSHNNTSENEIFIDKLTERSNSDDKSRNNSMTYDSDEYVKLDTTN